MKRILPFVLSSFLIVLPALAADTTRPNVGVPGPGQATANAPVTITAEVSDAESGIASCRLYVDNDDVGAMTVAGNQASTSYAFAQAGIHTMFVFCRDNENNFNSGANASVTVTAPSGGDGTPPSVGPASPNTAAADIAVTITAAVSDTVGVTGCQLLVNGFTAGAMTVAGGTASRTHVFESAGTYNVSVQCSDAAGNTGTGLVVVVSVADTPPPPPPPLLALTPALVKLACPAGAAADHPCKAVYYRDSAGKRHAFPNAKVYFTWYPDFSGVEEIAADAMAALPLGGQVTYRPGVKLVKFTTLNNVYAVSRGGLLRWIKTEAVATALYGADWNTKVDDISDAFFTDYTFGADVDVASEFSPATETAAASTIEQDL